jgi:hypothetical protein
MKSSENLTYANEHESFGWVESSSSGKADFIKPDCFGRVVIRMVDSVCFSVQK